MKAHYRFFHVILASILIRIALIFYSEWHDQHATVKYTDIDYRVFTDASRFLLLPTPAKDGEPENIAQGPLGRLLGFGDPYHRETYRYTPLLALILTPNIFLHPTFGKFLFSACDLLVGYLLYKLLLSIVLPSAAPNASNQDRERLATFYSALHLLNPMVFSISTRGSSESTLGALVIGTLYLAMRKGKTQRDWDTTAVLLGCATHWKIYPLIYGVSIVAVIAFDNSKDRKDREGTKLWMKRLISIQSFRFAVVSAGTFMLLNVAMYLIWGYPFLYETYLYHIHRLDGAHNFSPYWLPIQLTENLPPEEHALWQRFARSPLASFVPQMLLALGSGLRYGSTGARHLPFTWFVQTAAFVTLNKVCTSQYFLWYLTILPLVLPSLSFTRLKAISLISAWVGAQAVWLKFAYDLEFLKQEVHYIVWSCSLLFLVVNLWILTEIVYAYQWETPTTSAGQDDRKTR